MDILRELIAIEIEHLRRQGRTVLADTYIKQYPTVDRSWIYLQFGVSPGEETRARSAPTPPTEETGDWTPTPQVEATTGFVPATISARALPGSRLASQTAPSPIEFSATARRYVSEARFREKHFHAAGGIGEVFLAHDETLGRDVALKRMKPERADGEDARLRFQREAEITGYLEHPGIVPIYHYGTRDDGLPYYLMRFVNGRTFESHLVEYHKDFPHAIWRRHDPRQRRLLSVFLTVCRTVHFAHQKGVIHRDLKPHNVIIDDTGETLVVDWGMARRLNQAAEPLSKKRETSIRETDDLTQEGTVQGTLPYMSPEQAWGELNLQPATDIFALGAILYRVLAGRHPYVDEVSKAISIDRVRKGEYTPLNTRSGKIPAALAAIVAKALQARVDQRYATAAELAMEVERWLADEPLASYQESRYERIRRWLRRNETRVFYLGVALMSVFAVATIAFLLVNAAWRAEAKQRKIAEKSRAEALSFFQGERSAVDKWLTSAAEVMRCYPGVQRAREEMLGQAAEHYENFAAAPTADPELMIERGQAYLRLGDVRSLLGQQVTALEAFEKAEEIMGDVADRSSLPAARNGWGLARIRRSLLLAHQNQTADALALLRKTRLALATNDIALCEARAYALANEIKLLVDAREFSDASKLVSAADEAFVKLVTEQPHERKHRRSQALFQVVQGNLQFEQGNRVDGIARLRAAIELLASLAGETPADPVDLEELSQTRVSLALAYRDVGQPSEERAQYRAAIYDFERLQAALPDVPRFMESIVLTRIDLAQLLFEQGDLPAAKSELLLAADVLRRVRQGSEPLPRYEEEAAAIADALAEVFREQGDAVKAMDHVREGISCLEALTKEFPHIPQYHERLAVCFSHLAQCQELAGDRERAIASYRQGLDQLSQEGMLGETGRSSIIYLQWYLGEALLATNQRDLATESFQQLKRRYSEFDATRISSLTKYAYARFLLHCEDKSQRDTIAARKIIEEITRDAPNNPDFQLLAASLEFRERHTSEGLAFVQNAIRLRTSSLASDQLVLSLLLWQAKESESARVAYRQGKLLFSENYPQRRETLRLIREAELVLAAEKVD